jgi:Rrf2 family protein
MIKLSKKIEYAIIAIQYIAAQNDKMVSAKEISEKLNLSFEFLAKTLQSLMKKGLINSYHGIHGGYNLAKKPEEITVGSIINAIEPKKTIVDCFSDSYRLACSRTNFCSIRHSMEDIQNKIDDIFNSTTIAELSKNYFSFENIVN